MEGFFTALSSVTNGLVDTFPSLFNMFIYLFGFFLFAGFLKR